MANGCTKRFVERGILGNLRIVDRPVPCGPTGRTARRKKTPGSSSGPAIDPFSFIGGAPSYGFGEGLPSTGFADALAEAAGYGPRPAAPAPRKDSRIEDAALVSTLMSSLGDIYGAYGRHADRRTPHDRPRSAFDMSRDRDPFRTRFFSLME